MQNRQHSSNKLTFSSSYTMARRWTQQYFGVIGVWLFPSFLLHYHVSFLWAISQTYYCKTAFWWRRRCTILWGTLNVFDEPTRYGKHWTRTTIRSTSLVFAILLRHKIWNQCWGWVRTSRATSLPCLFRIHFRRKSSTFVLCCRVRLWYDRFNASILW